MSQHCDRQTIILSEHNKLIYISRPFADICSFVNAVQRSHNLPHELQSAFHAQDAPAPVSHTADASSISRLYEAQYAQRIKQHDDTRCKSQVLTSTTVVGAREASNTRQILLETKHLQSGVREISNPFDCVIAAPTFERTEHQKLLERLKDMLDSSDGSVAVDSSYKVNFRRGRLAANVGIWVINSFDSKPVDVFSFLALRTEKILQSLLAHDNAEATSPESARAVRETRATL